MFLLKFKKIIFTSYKSNLIYRKYNILSDIYVALIGWPLGLIYPRFRNLERYKLEWLDGLLSAERTLLRNKVKVKVFPPKFFGKSRRSKSVFAPELYLYKIRKALVHCESSSVIVNNQVYIERYNGFGSDVGNYSTGYVIHHSDDYAVISKKEVEEVELKKCIFLGGNGSVNYYHWMYEHLPKLIFLIEKGVVDSETCILVNEVVFKLDQFREMLKILLGDIEPVIYSMSERFMYKVKNLYYLESPNNVVFNLSNPYVPYMPEFCYFRPDVIKKLRNKLLKKSLDLVGNFENPSVVFLARKKGRVRDYNQEEVIAYLKMFIEFDVVYNEELSFVEQVSLFNGVNVVIGPNGAAFSNLIFCKPKTKVYSWLNKENANFSVYATLAAISGLEMEHFEIALIKDNENIHSGYSIEMSMLDEIVKCIVQDLELMKVSKQKAALEMDFCIC